MAISKLIFNGVIQMDLTSDTVTASVLNSGYTAHDAAGEAITGTGSGGGDSGNWMGLNPTKIHTFTTQHVLFKDSPVATWTYSTTRETLAASTNYPDVTVDNTHEYVHVVRLKSHYEYGNWTPVRAIVEYGYFGAYSLYLAASNPLSGNINTLYVGGTIAGAYRLKAYNANGNLTTAQTSAGVYTQSAASPSLAGGGTSTPVITCKTPILYLIGNTSYFDQTAYENLDMNNSYYDLSSELWEVDASSTSTGNGCIEVLRMLGVQIL